MTFTYLFSLILCIYSPLMPIVPNVTFIVSVNFIKQSTNCFHFSCYVYSGVIYVQVIYVFSLCIFSSILSAIVAPFANQILLYFCYISGAIYAFFAHNMFIFQHGDVDVSGRQRFYYSCCCNGLNW